MAKKPTDLTTGKNTEIEEEDGGSGEIDINESTYSKLEREHGFDFSEMSMSEIREVIHQYSQEGKLNKGAKVYNLKGELISHKAKNTQTKSGGRSYQVKESSREPMTREAFEKEKADRDYKESSEKQDKPAPGEPFNPTPKGPAA
jgi:hypothetical protein